LTVLTVLCKVKSVILYILHDEVQIHILFTVPLCITKIFIE